MSSTPPFEPTSAEAQSLFDASGLGMWTYDRPSGAVYCSDVALRLLGLEGDALPQSERDWLDIVHPDDRSALLAALVGMAAGPRVGEAMELRVRVDGWRWVRVVGRIAAAEPDGAAGRWMGTVQALCKETPKPAEPPHPSASDPAWTGLLDDIEQAIYICSESGHFIDVNKGAERMYGHSREWLVGRTPADVAAPGRNDMEAVRQALWRTLHEGSRECFDFWALRATGEVFLKEVHLKRERYRGQQVVVALAMDLTARLEPQRLLEAERLHLRTLMDSLPDLVWVVDADCRFLYCNRRLEELCGEPEQGVTGQPLTALFDEPSGEVLARLLASARTRDESQLEEASLGFSNGWYRGQFQVIATPMRDSAGTTLGVLAVARDLTLLHRAKSRLADRERLLASIVDNAGDGIELIDADSLRYIEINDAACGMLGYERDQIEDLTLDRVQAELTLPQLRQRIGEIVDSGGASFETKHRRRDGSVIDVQISIRTLTLHGRPMLISIWRDISDRRRNDQRARNRLRVLEMLAEASSLDELARTLIGNLEADLPGAVCAMMLLDDSGTRVSRGIAPRLETRFRDALVGMPIDVGVGPCAMSVSEPRVVIVEDIALEPCWASRLPLAQAAGIRACWSTPILGAEGRRLGILDVFYGEPRGPGPGELEHVEETARLAGVSIERHTTLTALRAREEIYSAIVNHARDGILLLDPKTGRLVESNPSTHEALGYARDEIDSLRIYDFVADLSAAEIDARMALILERGGAFFEARHRTKAGELLDVEVSATRVEVGGKARIAAIMRDVTSQRRAQEALAEAEQRFRKLFEDSAEAILLIENNRFIDCNPAALKMLRLPSVEDLRNRHPSSLSPLHQPDGQASQSKAEAMIAAAFETGSNLFEWEHLRADGESFIAEVLLTPIHYHNRRVLHVVWRDITARKRMELALRVSQERLEQAMLGATDGLWDWNLETDEVYYSPRWLEMLGYGPDELEPTLDTWRQLIHPDDEARTIAHVGEYLAGARPRYEIEFRMRHKAGHWVDILSRAREARDASGVPISPRRLVGTHVDISERKRAEQKLRERELFLRQTQQAAAIGGWLADPKHDRAVWTEGTYDIFGVPYDFQPTLERSLSFFTKESRARVHEALQRGLSHAESFVLQLDLSAGPGKARVVELRGGPQLDSDGRAQYLTGTLQDVTQRVAAERELQEYRQFLELKVMERTAELERAKELAEAANLAKSTFLANMSHEIRTPMNAIIGLAHILQRKIEDPAERGHIDKIAHAADHLLRIINDVLDLSKIEAGKLTLDIGLVHLEETARNVIHLVQERAQEKGLALRWTVDASLAVGLEGDAHRIGQILLNLLSNAVKFTERGSVDLRIDAMRRHDEPWLVRFQIRDTGIGLTEDQIARLFQPFEQADSSTTRRYGGTGLGLVICKRLAALMGGEIGVRSQVGKGSVFWLTLPMAPGDSSQPAAAVEPVGADDLVAILSGRSVLLAEDNPINQQVAQALLEQVGMRVTIAADGEEAVAMANASTYDAVLMDMQMPVKDGVEATLEIRRLAAYGDVPIIAMTANAFDEDRERCLEAGMNDHVPKPTDPDRLYATLARWLARAV